MREILHPEGWLRKLPALAKINVVVTHGDGGLVAALFGAPRVEWV